MLGPPVRQEWRRVTTSSQQPIISPHPDCSNKGSAKAQLHELCAREHWRHPLYECCKDEGPPHLKQFTFKVVVCIEGTPTAMVECIGNPRTKKKAAADDAAKGALWCLKQMGY